MFGDSFGQCAIPSVYDPDNTPVIIKFNANGSVNEVNSDLFPTISGDEFSFTFTSSSSGSWLYTPGTSDPSFLVSFMVAKGGPNFNLFSVTGNSGMWFTPINPNNQQPYDLSHLTFFWGDKLHFLSRNPRRCSCSDPVWLDWPLDAGGAGDNSRSRTDHESGTTKPASSPCSDTSSGEVQLLTAASNITLPARPRPCAV